MRDKKNKSRRFRSGGATAISDFSFCLLVRALRCQLSRIFPVIGPRGFLPLVEDFLMSQLDKGSRVLGVRGERNTVRE